MTDQRRLSDGELDEIEQALDNGTLRSTDRLEQWVQQLLAEARRGRSGVAASADAAPAKRHGDALLDRSGSRHGESPPTV